MAGPHTVLILALDTTTRAGSIAVVRLDEPAATDDGLRMDVLALVPGDAARTHGERLPAEFGSAIDRAGVSKTAIDLLAVATGPGAFTGLRIGLAAIQGLAMALDRPAVGVSALDALVLNANDAPVEFVAPWMDAQRGDVFAALHGEKMAGADIRQIVEGPVAENPEVLLERWRQGLRHRTILFVGDAVDRDRDRILRVGGSRWSVQVPGPLAPAIASLGARGARRGLAGPPHALTPIYVRRSDAEIERDRRSRL